MRELNEWRGFERVHGPILLHERIDAAAARTAWAVAAAGGAKGMTPEDFMPEWDARARFNSTAAEQSPEAMMGVMRSIQRSKRR